MKKRFFIILTGLLILTGGGAFAADDGPPPATEVTPEKVKAGMEQFMAVCNQCHGLKYYRDKEHLEGIAPLIAPQAAKSSFGVEPPDLSTMAIARGKGDEGVIYIYRLLTTYYRAPDGAIMNRAFAEATHSEGRIAMPEPIPGTDPMIKEKSMDIAIFLHTIAEPADKDRTSIGRYVMAYMIVLTVILWALNRVTWKHVK